jgi:hypothetical protein
MSTTAILPQDGVEAFITRETEALAAHLFATTYGADWRAAWRQAIELLPELLAYAATYDQRLISHAGHAYVLDLLDSDEQNGGQS